jgi:hypothetical protein
MHQIASRGTRSKTNSRKEKMAKYVFNETSEREIVTNSIILENKDEFGLRILDVKIKSVQFNSEKPKITAYRITKSGQFLEDKLLKIRHSNNFIHLTGILISPSFSLGLNFENDTDGIFYGHKLLQVDYALKFKNFNNEYFMPEFEATIEKNRNFSI